MRVMGKVKNSRSQNGFGITEILVAMAVLGAAAVLLASIFKNVDQQTRKSRLISTMVALESSLLAAMEDKDNFQPIAAQLELAADTGSAVPALDLKSFNFVIARHPSMGSPLFFDSEGAVCTGSNCDISVEFDLKGGGGAIRGAYRIQLTPKAAKDAKASMMGGKFDDPADYTLSIARKFYRNPLKSTCSPGIARGMNKLTGEAICWDVAAPGDRCAPGEIMRGFVADASSGRMKPVCRKLRRASCNDNNYHVLQKINAYYLDPDTDTGGGAGGNCVPLMAASIPYQGNFACPMGHGIYHLQSQSGPCNLSPSIPASGAVTYEAY